MGKRNFKGNEITTRAHLIAAPSKDGLFSNLPPRFALENNLQMFKILDKQWALDLHPKFSLLIFRLVVGLTLSHNLP